MNTFIDLSSEILIDRSRIRNPYLRLMLTALGHEMARGSSWIAIDKEIALKNEFLLPLIQGKIPHAAA